MGEAFVRERRYLTKSIEAGSKNRRNNTQRNTNLNKLFAGKIEG